MADRMAVLNRGRIEQLGTAEEVYRSPRTAFVSGFIGETNLIKGRSIEVRGEFVMVETAGGPLVGRVTRPGWVPGPGEEVLLSIRPEAWRLDSGSGENGVTGKIVERSYLGQRIQYIIETAAGRQQVVELNPHLFREPGEQVVKLSARHADVAVLEA
jgi:ABC-type Fe3+/spermidine/putrescine transport system ATPase subunit